MLYIQTASGDQKIEIKHKITPQNVIRVLQRAQTQLDKIINENRKIATKFKLERILFHCDQDNPEDLYRKEILLDNSVSNDLVNMYLQVKDSPADCFVGAENPGLSLKIKDVGHTVMEGMEILDLQAITDAIIQHAPDLVKIDFEERQDLEDLKIPSLPRMPKLKEFYARDCNIPTSSLQEIIRAAPRISAMYFRSGMFERPELINMFAPQPCVFRAPPREDTVTRVNTFSKKSNSDTTDESCRLCMMQ